MKTISFLLLFAFTSTISFAQPSFKKGTKLNMHVATTGDSDMGMGMVISTTADMDFVIEVLNEKENVYEISSTLSSLKMAMNMMGQSMNYDSRNDSDKNSEIGKAMQSQLNAPVKYFLNKITGKITPEETTEKKSADQLGISGLGEGEALQMITDVFVFLTPEKIKAGNWASVDSSATAKTNTVYTIKASKGNESVISYERTSLVSAEMEQMGTSMNFSTNTKTKGEITADGKSMIATKNSSTSDITGTVQAGGQDVPFTGTKSTVITTTVL